MTCVDCSCKKVGIHSETCKELHEMNDSKVKGSSNVLKDTPLCDYPKVFPKIIYSMWCMFKNIIGVICWLFAKVNELIEVVNNLCKTVKCIVDYLKVKAQEELEKALGNVSFTMKSQGTSQGGTFTQISTYPDGSFTIIWNMILSTGQEVGRGVIKGKVLHTYSPNSDGTIQAEISGVVIQSVNYTATGVPNPTGNAKFTVKDINGNTLWSKDYNPATSFSELPNKTVKYNISKKLSARGGTSGDIKMLETVDDWDLLDTRGVVYANYLNNNEPVVAFPCDIKCTPINK